MSKPDLVKILEQEGFVPKDLAERLHTARLAQREQKPKEHEHYQRQIHYHPSQRLLTQAMYH